MIYDFFWRILAFLARIAFRFDHDIVAPDLWKVKIVKVSNCAQLAIDDYHMYAYMTATQDVNGRDRLMNEGCAADQVRNIRQVEDGCAPRITIKFYIPFRVNWLAAGLYIGHPGCMQGKGEQHTDLKPGIHTYEFFVGNEIKQVKKERN